MGNKEEALLILQEECAEVIHIANKALRFGLGDIHPVTGIYNRDALVQEIGDVFALVDILKAAGSIAKCNTWDSRKGNAILSGYAEKRICSPVFV